MAMLPLMGSATIDPARCATYIANHMCEHICEPILQLVAYCRASRALQCALKTALTEYFVRNTKAPDTLGVRVQHEPKTDRG